MMATYISRRYMSAKKFLITGGLGQLGLQLSKGLIKIYGPDSVLLTDIIKPKYSLPAGIHFEHLDVTDMNKFEEIIKDSKITNVVHLAVLLSAIAEAKPELAANININIIFPIFNLAKKYKLGVYIPSTIGAFGPESPRNPTPDICVQRPKTIYGIGKVLAELLGEYFFHKHNVDFRSLRYPGIISADSQPGGGTTDYSIHIFQDALKKKSYSSYLRGDSLLPMMHIDDCIRGTCQFIGVPSESLSQRVYNLGAVSFSPEILAKEIKKNFIPDFQISYDIDPVRQSISDSWPQVFDDHNARKDWNWKHEFDTKDIVDFMMKEIPKYHNVSNRTHV